jgi:hypothetical protein
VRVVVSVAATTVLMTVLPRSGVAAAVDLSAELRLQGEAISSETFGIGSRANDAVLQKRAMAQADIKQNHARLFLQLGVSVESWEEHLRQHHRIAKADREVQERAVKLHVGDDLPRVEHQLDLQFSAAKGPIL